MEGFFNLETMQEIPLNIRQMAWPCSSSIETADGGRCSGAFISPDGLYLTALHCLGTLLRKFSLVKDSSSLEAGELMILRVLEQNPNDVFAEGFYLGDNPKFKNPKIVFLGRGLHLLSAPAIMSRTIGELENAVDIYEDIALLKFDLEGTTVPFAKFGLDRIPTKGTPLWHISKPYKADRIGGPGSDGHSKYITKGFAIDLKKSEAFRDGPSACCSECEIEKLLRYYEGNRFFTTTDFSNGSSGGGVFDEEGNLLGINVIGLHNPAITYKSGSAGFHSIAALKKALMSFSERSRYSF